MTPASDAAARIREALSDDEIDALPKPDLGFSLQQVFRRFARTVEAALANRAKAASAVSHEFGDIDEDRCGPASLESELRFRHEHDLRNTPGYDGSLLCMRTEAALATIPAPRAATGEVARITASAGFEPVVWTEADERRLDEAIAARNVRRAADRQPARAQPQATVAGPAKGAK